MAESVTEEIAKRLGIYLRAQIPGLKNALTYFPEPNEKLLYPCVSLVALKPTFRAFQAYEKEKTDTVNFQSTVQYVVGIYDVPMQVDLWARNKEERDDFYELLFNALNPKIIPMGLSLQLKDYYNQWCSYDIAGFEFVEGEEPSQRGEFRARIELLTTCKAIRVGKQYIMETIEPTVEIYNSVENPEEFDVES